MRTAVFAGVVAGLALLLALTPAAVGVARISALLDGLALELSDHRAGQTSYVYANDGTTLMTMFFEEHRTFVPLVRVSPYVTRAVLAAEDARFFSHNGVDLRGLARAFLANRRGDGIAQGGSTLTMQYVRMSLRDGARTPQQAIAATEQTAKRKLNEIKLALELEKRWTKQQILEAYVNAAYFGHRAYGIHAAAQVFFGKTPGQLDLVEAATLAGLVKAPSAFDPTHKNRTARDRRDYVIRRMAELGYIGSQAAAEAAAQPLTLRLTEPPQDCASTPAKHRDWGFFCDLFKTWWMRQPSFGDSPAARLDALRTGGYRIVTSLDPKLQAYSQQDVTGRVPVGSRLAHGIVVVQPGTGRVPAMAVNRVYSVDQSKNGSNSDPVKRAKRVPGGYPNTVAPLLGGGDLPGYQAGSTFKMFTMLAALDAGMKMSTSFHAPQKYKSTYRTNPGDKSYCGGYWCPSNASASMTGKHNMYSGFGKSVNTYFVQLEQKVGADKAVRMAERLGLSWHTDIDRTLADPANAVHWGAFTLGVADTSPLEMAAAYATVAADGLYCKPLPVISITSPDGTEPVTTDAEGRTMKASAPVCHQAVSKDAARAATDAARCVTGYGAARGSCGGWSTGSRVHAQVGRPVAGKTGTTDDTRAAWFVGYTPELAAASFIADPDYVRNVAGDGNYNVPLDAVANALREALEGKPVRDFTAPPRTIL